MISSAQPGTVWRPAAVLRGISRVISLALLAGALFAILLMAYSVYLAHTPLLWVDQWMFVQELAGNHGHYSASLLWKQHNDHRIPFPKLFYLADLYLFHGRNEFLLALIFAIQLLHLGWLVAVFRRIGKLGGHALVTAGAFAALCLFSIGQSENFWFASDLPMVIPYLCATIAFSSLGFAYQRTAEGRPGSSMTLALIWLAATAASFSLSNGLILWPMLIVLMVALRAPSRNILATCLLGAMVVGFWRIGYAMPLGARAQVSVPPLVRYLLLLYGSSWPGLNESFGMVIAALAIPAAAVAYVWLVVRRSKDVFALVMLSIAAFALASTGVTAIGRIGMGVEQARAGRYQTAAMLFWGSLFVLLIRVAARARKPAIWLLPLQAALASAFLGTIHLAAPYTDGARIHARSMHAAALALEAGVNDSQRIMYVLVPPYRADDVMLLSGFLRDHHWSIFHETEKYPLGRNLNRFYKVVAPAACRGSLDPATPISGYRGPGFRFSGWAYDWAHASLPEAIILADSRNRIIGFGENGFPGPDLVSSFSYFGRNGTGFIGYIPADLESDDAVVYAILADGISACPLSAHPIHLDVAAAGYSGPEPTGLSRDLTLSPRAPFAALETVGGKTPGPSAITVDANAPTKLAGWMLDPALKPGRAMDLSIDGVPLLAEYGYDRPDIARRLSTKEAGASGFEAILPVLPPGSHTVAFRLISADQDYYFESRPFKILVP
jgi:hypothetical protein